jgi:hypothetical protein
MSDTTGPGEGDRAAPAAKCSLRDIQHRIAASLAVEELAHAAAAAANAAVIPNPGVAARCLALGDARRFDAVPSVELADLLLHLTAAPLNIASLDLRDVYVSGAAFDAVVAGLAANPRHHQLARLSRNAHRVVGAARAALMADALQGLPCVRVLAVGRGDVRPLLPRARLLRRLTMEGDATITAIDLSAHHHLRVIGPNFFRNSGVLSDVRLPARGLAVLGDFFLHRCAAVTAVAVPATVRRIGACAFQGCGIAAMDLAAADGLEHIGRSFCRDCPQLFEVRLPDSRRLKEIGPWFVYGAEALTMCLVPYVEAIGDSAFHGCPLLTTIDLDTTEHSRLRSVGANFGRGCAALTTCRLPATVRAIGDRFLMGCPRLRTVELGAAVETIGSFAFTESGVGVLDLSACARLRAIGDELCRRCDGLYRVVLPPSLEAVGHHLLCGCAALQQLEVGGAGGGGAAPPALETVGHFALQDAVALRRVDLSACARLASVGRSFAARCTNLNEVKLPDGVIDTGAALRGE